LDQEHEPLQKEKHNFWKKENDAEIIIMILNNGSQRAISRNSEITFVREKLSIKIYSFIIIFRSKKLCFLFVLICSCL